MSNPGTIQLEIEQLGREIFDLIDKDRRAPEPVWEKRFLWALDGMGNARPGI